MRIWRHVAQTSARHIVVYSPDTDVYNIGLSILDSLAEKDVFVQINVPHSQTKLYVHLNNLVKALQLDPDLASLERSELARTFQMLFITSGCDYVSYFAGLGKASFFQTFFQHAAFITGNQMTGSLSDTAESKTEVGFLAFLRLIGTLYFKKHYSALVSLKGTETPQQLFHACHEQNHQEKHLQWYKAIRAIVGDRITCEQERMPSHSSMWRHWLRSCWIASMWSNSSKDDLQLSLPSPDDYGWKKSTDGTYVVDWECPAVQQQVQDTINFLTKGCTCKKGCLSQRCGCKKGGRHCGPGCNCQNCQNCHNTSSTSDTGTQESLQTESDSESDTSSSSELANIETEITFDELDF